MSMQPLQDWQLPLTQVLPIWQLWQLWPPLPQREGVVLLMQTPAPVQQPEGHVAAEHELPPPPPVPPTHRPSWQVLWLAQS